MRGHLTLAVILIVLATNTSSALRIHSYGNWEGIIGACYGDGTLAITTWGGLVVARDGEPVRFIDTEHSLPPGGIKDVAVASHDILYLTTPCRVYRADLSSTQCCFDDITPDFLGEGVYPRAHMIATSSDGALWVGSLGALHRFDGEKWGYWRWPSGGSFWTGSLCVDSKGRAWVVDGVGSPQPWFFCLENGEWNWIEDISRPEAVAIDASGILWCVSRSGLWTMEADTWELVSEDALWGEVITYDVCADGFGRCWAACNYGLLRWDGELTLIQEAAGISLERPYWAFDYSLGLFTKGVCLGEDMALFGTCGCGVLVSANGNIDRLTFESGAPGQGGRDCIEDWNGDIWMLPFDFDPPPSSLARLHDGRFERDTSSHGLSTTLTMDVDGSLWVYSLDGPTVFRGSGSQLYEVHPWWFGSSGDPSMAIDREGTKWFTCWDEDEGAFSFDNERWTEYPTEKYFGGEQVSFVCVGPNDVKWFCSEKPVSFDGQNWEVMEDGPRSPKALSFDLEGNLIARSSYTVSIYRKGSGRDCILAVDGTVRDLAVDAEGDIWCAASGSLYTLYHYDGQTMRGMDYHDGLSFSNSFSIAIDHNGDKWVGSGFAALDRIQDGGPAQQKLDLSIGVSQGGEITLSGTTINTGAVIPVLLWLACEYEDSLYFYPDWGPSPTPTRSVLGAHSTETHELLRLDPAALPAGEYTFIGGISLTGGIHLMIGPRDDKLAFATYAKE